MKILFIGDVFGKQGRKAINNFLPKLKRKNKIDFVIANVENCTHGRSINLRHYKFLKSLGINVFTFGNHTWENSEVLEVLKFKDTVRPINIDSSFKFSNIGLGSRIYQVKNKKIRVTNLLGLDGNKQNKNFGSKYIRLNPFKFMDIFLESIKGKQDIHIVDYHANSTSEKNAFFCAFKGKVSAILCTHTHIQTADEKIKDNTGYITDVGMTGASDGIIGAKPETIIDMYREKVLHFKLEPDKSKYQLNGVILDFNQRNNKIKSIKRIFLIEGDKI